MPETITAIFDDAGSAENALSDLVQRGYIRERISVVLSEDTRGKHFAVEDTPNTRESVAAGMSAGSILGSLAVGFTAIATGGAILAAGPMLAALVGVGAGVALGGFAGRLVGLGVPEPEARLIGEDIGRGGILVGVETDEETQRVEVREILRDHGGRNLSHYTGPVT